MENIKPFNFKLKANDGEARAGIIETIHGNIKTPVFMPKLEPQLQLKLFFQKIF